MSNKKQSGFTLFELMLVVGIGAVLLLGMVQVSDTWIKYLKAEQAGEHMDTIRKAADAFLRNTSPAELNALSGALGTMQNISTNGDFESYLPIMTNPLRSPIGRNLTVLLRRTQSAPPVRTFYEIYIFTTGENIPNKMLLSASHAVGAYGGIISKIRNPAVASAESLFGTWSMDPMTQMPLIGTFIDTSATSNEVTADGGQMMVYFNVSPEEVPGPYLYRSVVGDPEFNTMFATLNMNSNNIVNAGDVGAINVTTTGDADVGAALEAASGTINGNLRSANFDVTAGMTVGGNLSLNGPSNNVTGNITADHIQSATIQSGNINSNNIGAQDMFAENGLSIHTGSLTATNTTNITVNGTIEADAVTVGTLLEVGGTISTGGVEVIGGDVTVNGDVILEGDLVTENIAIDDCLTLNGTEYGACPP